MLFNSLQFILFFLAFFLILFSIPSGARKYWLLAASCYFYMVFKPVYLLILFAVIVIDFVAGIKIEESEKNKKKWLILSLISNISILVIFKYFNFFNENISVFLNSLGIKYPIPFIDIILPIGLSFHTFQAMSYTIEVYRGKQPAERSICNYALYVLYFPQLVAGPIERPQHLLPQLKKSISFDGNNALNGLFRISLGLFKKVVIADRLALFTDPVFNDIAHANGLSVLIATFFFAFEIYCDFAGYTDIAVGTAQMMGISLVENFRTPYFSISIREFWTRWHISLSSWFRDYVYIPLGGNKATQSRWIFNIVLVFFLSGLWHGARWSFIVWGLLHGSLLIAERMAEKRNINLHLPKFLKLLFTFCFVCLAWIFFRVKEVQHAFIALNHLLHLSFKDTLPKVFNRGEMVFVCLLIATLLMTEFFIKRNAIKNRGFLMIITTCVFLLCYLFGEFNFKQFIYFQF